MRENILRLSMITLVSVSIWACSKEEMTPIESCNVEQPLALEITSDDNLIDYCMSIIEISEQINKLLISEENIDSSYLNNPYLDSLSTFESVFADAGFSMNVEMSNLMEDVLNSTDSLMEESPYLAKMSESELEDLFTLVINDLIAKDISVGATPSSICKTRYNNAVSNCRAMATVGYAAVGISAFFTLGLGTLIGATTVTFGFNECLNQAKLDYDFCKKNIKR